MFQLIKLIYQDTRTYSQSNLLRRLLLTIICTRWSLPFRHQKLYSRIFSVTQGICTHQISLQHQIYLPSAQSVAHHLKEIKSTLKRVQCFLLVIKTHVKQWLIIRHTLQYKLTILSFLKVFILIHLKNIGSRRCRIWKFNWQTFTNLQLESSHQRIFWM